MSLIENWIKVWQSIEDKIMLILEKSVQISFKHKHWMDIFFPSTNQ